MVVGNIIGYVVEKNTKQKSQEEKEGFQQNTPVVGLSIAGILWQIMNFVIFVLAIFLSFKRNDGFNFGSFLAACCCPICYLVYALAVPIGP